MAKILNQREKIVLWLTIGIIAAAVLLNYAITPLFQAGERTQREIVTARNKLKKYRALLGQKDTLAAVAGIQDVQEKLSGKPRDSLVAVLFELENMAKKAGVQIVDIRPQVQKQNRQIMVDMRMEGALAQYISFIYDVEHSLLLFQIKRTQLGVKPNVAGLEGNFTIVVPLQVE
jgi:DNA-directed RNA polymerase subunit F